MEVTFTVPDAAVGRVVAALEGLYPRPTNMNGTPLVSSGDWAKECIRLWVIRQVARHETKVAMAGVQIAEDPTVISVNGSTLDPLALKEILHAG